MYVVLSASLDVKMCHVTNNVTNVAYLCRVLYFLLYYLCAEYSLRNTFMSLSTLSLFDWPFIFSSTKFWCFRGFSKHFFPMTLKPCCSPTLRPAFHYIHTSDRFINKLPLHHTIRWNCSFLYISLCRMLFLLKLSLHAAKTQTSSSLT